MTLRTETVIQAPAARCFDLARSVELHAASARPIRGRAVGGRTAGLAGPGDRTTWSARFFGIRFALTTQITAFNRPHSFSDRLCAGLPRRFEHVYTFAPRPAGGTLMTDEFTFESPFGLFGAACDRLLLRRRMQAVMEHRAGFLRQAAESEEWREYVETSKV